MSKLNIDTSKLRTDFIPCINNSINDLNSIVELCDSLELPNGFSYTSYLKKKLPNKIIATKNELINVNKFVNNSIYLSENIVKNSNNLFNKEKKM